MSVVLETLATRNILLLEGNAVALRDRYHPQTQYQRYARDDRCGDKVWPHKSLETHTSREHSHNLGLVCQLRGEEYAGDKGEERTKLVYEEGDKVQVVVEEYLLEGCVSGCEVVNLLHIVENHHHNDNHHYGEDVGAEELTNDVAVEDLQPRPPIKTLSVSRLHHNLNSKCKIQN